MLVASDTNCTSSPGQFATVRRTVAPQPAGGQLPVEWCLPVTSCGGRPVVPPPAEDPPQHHRRPAPEPGLSTAILQMINTTLCVGGLGGSR